MTAIPVSSFRTVPQPRLRMTSRGRRVLLALASAPLMLAALLYAVNGGGATATDSGAPVEYVTVLPGQSLWAVAEQIAPHDDPREVIDDLVSYNALTEDAVRAGERLAIPSAYLD
jgi:LysM repeat protein